MPSTNSCGYLCPHVIREFNVSALGFRLRMMFCEPVPVSHPYVSGFELAIGPSNCQTRPPSVNSA
jgi:hypothetical protein